MGTGEGVENTPEVFARDLQWVFWHDPHKTPMKLLCILTHPVIYVVYMTLYHNQMCFNHFTEQTHTRHNVSRTHHASKTYLESATGETRCCSMLSGQHQSWRKRKQNNKQNHHTYTQLLQNNKRKHHLFDKHIKCYFTLFTITTFTHTSDSKI